MGLEKVIVIKCNLISENYPREVMCKKMYHTSRTPFWTTNLPDEIVAAPARKLEC